MLFPYHKQVNERKVPEEEMDEVDYKEYNLDSLINEGTIQLYQERINRYLLNIEMESQENNV